MKDSNTVLSDADQILYMNNERFTVPEIVFHPSDIGEHICSVLLRYTKIITRIGTIGFV